VYDRNPGGRGHLCAWGSFEDLLGERLRRVGLDLEDYVLSKVDHLVLNGVLMRIRNLIIVDKPRMLEDLLPTREVVKRGVKQFRPRRDEVLVNATSQPFGECHKIATTQQRTVLRGLEPNTVYVYIHPRFVGYGWAFPLSDDGGDWHLGAGCSNGNPAVLVDLFRKRYNLEGVKPLCSCGREISVVSPEDAVLVKDGVVSIGEAAGAVEPIAAEGMLSSIDSAELLYSSFGQDDFRSSYEGVMRGLLSGYGAAHRMWGLMHRHHRWAWLRGFSYIVERADKSIKPELTAMTKLRLVKEILFGR
jgi:hypothetical protein